MPAAGQDLITFIAGSEPRVPEQPLIYLDVSARCIRVAFGGMIMPLSPIAGQRFDYERAIDAIIAQAKGKTP